MLFLYIEYHLCAVKLPFMCRWNPIYVPLKSAKKLAYNLHYVK